MDEQTKNIAREILEGVGEKSEGWIGSLESRLLEWSMDHPSLKTPLFRFVDVLPTLHDSSDVLDHLHEYFPDDHAASSLPALAEILLKTSQLPFIPSMLTAPVVRWGVRRLARRFIAGETRKEISDSLEDLLNEGFAFSVDRLGEEVLSKGEAQRYQQDYLDLLEDLARIERGPDDRPFSISLKLTAFDPHVEPMAPTQTAERIMERLLPILRKARDQAVIVYLDMEQNETRALTLDIARQILERDEFSNWNGLGVVIQAYLKQSKADLQELSDWAEQNNRSLWVRLVKGAYWDVERIRARQNNWRIPVYEHKGRTDQNFEDCAELLVEAAPRLKPAFASHNVRSLSYGIACVRAAELPDEQWECQMLYGMGTPIQHRLQEMGVPVRIYTPFGDLIPGMAYLVRRLLENTSNEGFLRKTFYEGESAERLVAPPDPDQGHAATTEPRGYRTVGPSPFHRESVRKEQQKTFNEQYNCAKDIPAPLVAGGWRDSGQTITSINPSRHGQTVGTVGTATREQVREAIRFAREEFSRVRSVDTDERANKLERIAEGMQAQRRSLTALITRENGKNWREADADVMEAIDFCRYYAREARKLSDGHRWEWPGETNDYQYEARGPTAVIAPWNFPLAILTGMTTAALVTGNPVLLKPSSETPVIAGRFVEIAVEAGFDSGELQFLPGSGSEVGRALVRAPEIATIAFTGSREVGLKIDREATQPSSEQSHLKQTVLEMGGKNAIIVDRNANLDRAVEGIVRSAFGYQGQKCSACSRVIAIGDVGDPLVERLVESTRSLPLGPADDPKNFMGPVINESAKHDIVEYRKTADRQGEVVLDGPLPDGLPEGYYIPPMIVDQVAPDATIACEEIFGPILSVIRADSLDESLRIANDVDYALTGGLYSRAPSHIERAKAEFRVGNLYINRSITGALVGRQPFGGYKMSGTGTKAGGPDYLKNFVWPRTITENTVRRGFAPDEMQ